MRSDSKDLIDFYIRDLNNVFIIYIESDNGRIYHNIDTSYNGETISIINNTINIPNNYDILFHYHHDIYRKDKYKNINSNSSINVSCFQEAFYKLYDIDFMTRINKFSIIRDIELENKTYDNFINKFSDKYILYHDDENNSRLGPYSVNTKINFENKLNEFTYVNLNLMSNVFFDYIKILINSKEIHLIDSIWGALIFKLDAKYRLFNHINIYIYALRGHNNIFINPTLNNWHFK